MADEKKRTTSKQREADDFIALRLAYAVLGLLFCLGQGPGSAFGQVQTSSESDPTQAEAVSSAALDRKPVVIWDTEVRMSLDGGYRENVLRTSVAPEETAFVHSTAEVSFIRLSESGFELSLFALAEDWRYPDCASVDYEQLASATAQALWPVGERQEISAEIQYFYQHQVLDLSETDTDLRRLLVEGHSIQARPSWRLHLNSNWALRLEASGTRQIYAGDRVDDYWEPAGRVSLLRNFGKQSEASGYFQVANRRFDTWEQYDTSGGAITNSHLEYWRPEVGGQIRHFWDKDRHWRTITRVSYLWNQDNGTSYFDFGRLIVSQQLRWRAGSWEIRGGVRAGWYQYDTQRVADEKRTRSYILADLRIERRFGKHLFAFAAGEREWNFSNDPRDEYEDLWIGCGIGVGF